MLYTFSADHTRPTQPRISHSPPIVITCDPRSHPSRRQRLPSLLAPAPVRASPPQGAPAEITLCSLQVCRREDVTYDSPPHARLDEDGEVGDRQERERDQEHDPGRERGVVAVNVEIQVRRRLVSASVAVGRARHPGGGVNNHKNKDAASALDLGPKTRAGAGQRLGDQGGRGGRTG